MPAFINILMQILPVYGVPEYCSTLEGWKGLGGWNSNQFTDSGTILKAMDIGHLEDEDISKREFMKILTRQQAEYLARSSPVKGNLPNNVRQLAKMLRLDETDQALLMFAVILHSHRGLEETADALELLTSENTIQVLAVILDIAVKDIRSSLGKNAILQRAGLLRLAKSGTETLNGKLELADGLDDIMLLRHANVMSMLELYFHPASAPQFTGAQFPHVAEDLDVLETYLKEALEKRQQGANILLYGAPGTGKTEFARMLSKQLGAQLFEVSTADEDGDPLGDSHRFRAFKLTQEALSQKKNSIILFDEIEDVFPSSFAGFGGLFPFRRDSGENKGWINKLLEENPVPAIWISNSIEQIDNAYIRRFDYVLEIANPPRSIRAEILKKNLSATGVSRQWIEAISENRNLSPAVVARAAKVATLVGRQDPQATQKHMERAMGNTMKAMGYGKQIAEGESKTLTYQLNALNPDCDINDLIKGLKHHGAGRICLYGPPGTGKSEFGKFAARMLDKPLLVKRASDLLDMYVGQTEKLIAAMFEEAEAEDAVLLLDEADSFLRDRRGANASWEVTQVNELLTRMESYEGLFICSTNLIDNLDAASIRRFDFKIKLDYMTPAQACLVFRQVLKDQGVRFRMSKQWAVNLARYKNLTPGDFATVVRQSRFSAQPLTPDLLFDGLTKASDFKEDNGTAGMGFTADL